LDNRDKVEEYLQKIEVSVHKLDGFIQDIIDFSRNARVEIEVVPIDFEKLIHEVIDNLMYLDEKNAIKRIVHVIGKDVFYTDKKRLTIILNNLISNSIKYFNSNAKEPFIEVSVTYTNREATVTVHDNGIGIAPEHVNNIFKMFYRGDEKSRGSGLGLYIVKETVDKIKGTISVKSEYGSGSTFTLIIPALSTRKTH
jgi:signal transduction histidine kinase